MYIETKVWENELQMEHENMGILLKAPSIFYMHTFIWNFLYSK